jgi:hypothetical protein
VPGIGPAKRSGAFGTSPGHCKGWFKRLIMSVGATKYKGVIDGKIVKSYLIIPFPLPNHSSIQKYFFLFVIKDTIVLLI